MRIERCSTPAAFDLATASRQSVADVFHRLGTTEEGLTSDEAATGRRTFGANVLASHRTAFGVFVRQIRNPLLILLLVAAAVSATTGDITDAGIIAAIVTLSVGLGLRLFADGARVVAVAHSRRVRTRPTGTRRRAGPAPRRLLDVRRPTQG